MICVGFDPGLRVAGVAVTDVQSGRLLRAWLVKSPEKEDSGAQAWLAMGRAVAGQLHGWLAAQSIFAVDLLVVEHMAIRARPGARPGSGILLTKNPGTILTLAAVTGAVVGSVSARQVVSAYPSQWKGGGRTSGDDASDSIWNMLPPSERAAAEGAELKSTGHNVLDAVGMSKWGARRLKLRML